MTSGPPEDVNHTGLVAVLGPPCLVSGLISQPVRGKPARLLVALAAADHELSQGELMDVVWGERPPDTARAALHVHLGTLRRHLDSVAPGPTLVRGTTGYRLVMNGWSTDFALASQLAGRARAGSTISPGDALRDVTSALALWRGEPFSADGEPVDDISHRCASILRMELDELRVSLLLDLGSLAEAERLATELVAREPFREVRWAQLMRVHYANGRTRDALETFQHARQALVEGMGVEPGPILTAVERAVLTHDEAFFRPTPDRPRPTVEPDVPLRPRLLVGRELDLRRCLAALDAGRVVSLSGPPGVGKTTLLCEIFHRAPATTVWIDLERSASLPGDLYEQTAGVRTLIDQRVGVVIVDGADDRVDELPQYVERLRRYAPHVRVIVGSRRRPALDDAVHVQLATLAVPQVGATRAELDENPAVQLLESAIDDLAPSARLTDRELVELCRATDGLPLAMRLAAAGLRAAPPSEIAASVRAGIRPILLATIAQMTPAAESTLRQLVVIPHAFDRSMAAAVCAAPGEQTLRSIEELVDVGFVVVAPESIRPYRLLEPLRPLLDELLTESGEREATMNRLADWAIGEARLLGRAALEGGADVSLAAVGELVPTFSLVVDHLIDIGDIDKAAVLGRLIDAPLYLGGAWTEREAILRTIVAAPQETPTRDRAKVMVLAERSGPLSTTNSQRLRAAVRAAEAAGDESLTAYARHLLGINLWWAGDLDAAIAEHRWAAAHLGPLEPSAGAEVRKYLAIAMVQRGQVTEGLRALAEVGQHYQRLDNVALHGHTLALAGHCHRELGDDEAAVADWLIAADELQRSNNRASEIHVQLGLGEVRIERGDADGAFECARRALHLVDATELHVYETWAWTVAMRVAVHRGDTDAMFGCATTAVRAASDSTAGEVRRLAFELSIVAGRVDRWTHAARLIGCADAHQGPFELPFTPPATTRRWLEHRAEVVDRLGPAADAHIAAGSRCTIHEATGSLFEDWRR